MNSLMSYGSDDDSNDSGDNKFPEMPGRQNVSSSKSYRKPAAHEDNYEEVGMDMSEESDDSGGPPSKNPNQSGRQDRPNHHSSFAQQNDRKSGSRSPKNRKEEEKRPGRAEEGRNRDDRYRSEDKYRRRERDERGSRDSRDDDRRSRDSGSREDDRERGRDRDRHKDDRRDNSRYSRDRDRRDRDRRRSRSRGDRRRSRSPRRSSRSPRRSSRSPRRSRSGSREKGKFLSRREKADKRMDRLDKLGIQFKPDNYPASAIEEAESRSKNTNNGDRFFMPGITGRFRDQIEKRKQLWQKAKDQEPGPSTAQQSIIPSGGSKATKVYEATTFSDDKTSSKFKRLMGIKDTNAEQLPVKATDVLKKQQEMFTSMEAQYEVARTATHTMRGVGLGFGSFQR